MATDNSRSRRTLSLVVPVWNEIEAIDAVLENVAGGREALAASPFIERLEVIIVDDGSTDGTPERAAARADVVVLRETHRGYGAALKSGFRRASGELLAFMDGDNTCDVRSLARMVERLETEKAHIVNGNRLHRDSRMPPVRLFANRMAGRALAFVSRKPVQDSCSGMRVFRREILPLVERLPDDLSFSPALTAAVLYSDHLKLTEAPISYAERLGKSKLALSRDFWRFFKQAFWANRRRSQGGES
jgi:glycosyltransferase involved in cell wall biosynthesis